MRNSASERLSFVGLERGSEARLPNSEMLLSDGFLIGLKASRGRAQNKEIPQDTVYRERQGCGGDAIKQEVYLEISVSYAYFNTGADPYQLYIIPPRMGIGIPCHFRVSLKSAGGSQCTEGSTCGFSMTCLFSRINDNADIDSVNINSSIIISSMSSIYLKPNCNGRALQEI